MHDEEQPLSGGNVAVGVVRVGDTVRKPAGPWTPAVHAFLDHLHGAGFTAAPRSLGVDEEGRHVVEWIDGETTHPYAPVSDRSPSLGDVGRLVRDLHDAAAEFVPPPDARWNVVIPPDEAQLIVHHDLAAWNFVHGDGRAVFIDWDLAAPGSRLWDLAWAAHSFAGLAPGREIETGAARLRALVDGYGLDEEDRHQLVDVLPARYRSMVDLLRRGHRDGVEPWARLWRQGHGTAWQGIARYAAAHGPTLRAALTA